MPSWKKVIVSGSDAVLTSVTASFLGNLTGTSSFAVTAATASTADNFYVRGNVGIGSAAPAYRIDVAGGSINTDTDYRLDGVIVLENNTTYTMLLNPEGARTLYMGDSGDRANYYDNNSHIFRSAGGTSTYGLWRSTGLGINTTNPSERLHVSGNIRVDTPSNNNVGNGLRLNRPGSFYAGFEIATSNVVDWSIGANSAGFGIYQSGLAATTRLNINSAGNVGIGTTSPSERLHVSGNIYLGTGNQSIRYRTATNWDYYLNATNDDFRIYDSDTTYFLQAVYNGGSTNKYLSLLNTLTVRNNGNVGIGTTNPTLAKLQILGNVSASAYTGSLFGTASFATTASYVNLAACSEDIKVTNWDQPDPGQTFYYTQVLSLANNCQDLTTLDTFGLHYESTPNLHYLDTGLTVTGSIIATTGFTGNLTGTASFANNATSASYARTASYAANATNIYNTDGSLTNNRFVDFNGNNLTFSGTEGESVYFDLTNAGTFEITGNPIIRTTGSLQHSGSSYFVGGNVGIGTTNPQTTFVVNGSTWINQTSDYFGGGTTVQVSAGGTGAVGIQANTFYLYPYSGNTPSSLIYGYNGNPAWGLINTGGRAKFDFFNYGSSATVMTLTSGSNVGIGNTTPALRLDIVDNGAKTAGIDEALIRIRSTDQYGASIHMSGSSNWRIISTGGGSTPGGGDLGFYNDSGGAYRIVIQGSDGNVGIGSTVPAHRLDVNAGSSVNVARFYNSSATSTILTYGDTGNSLYTETIYSSNGGLASIFKSGQSYTSYGGPKALNIYNEQAGIHFFPEGTGTARMSITGSNVGIGNANPLRKLHVVGDLAVNAGAGQYYGVYINGAGEGANPSILIGDWHNASGIITWDSTSRHLVIDSQYSTGPADIVFTGNDSATEYMRLDSVGNVGIGSASPAQKLDVNGAIKASLSAVNQANLVMYNSSTGLLTYLATSSFSVVSSSYAVSSSFSTFAATANYANSAGSATNADNVFVQSTVADQNYSLVLAVPDHDEYEELSADSTNASYNPGTGTLTAVRLVETSALKYKDNIESLGSTLDQVLKLRGVSFTKKNTGEQQIGFIADEIEKEFPQIVTKDNQGEIHGLSYQRMTAVLLESVKDLNSKIEAQNLFIKDLLDRIEKLENK